MKASTSQQLRMLWKPGPNALVFLFCTLLASIFWLVKALEDEYTTKLDFPIDYQSFPKNRVLKDSLPSAVKLKVRSTGLQLLKIQLRKQSYPLAVDLSNVGNGHSIKLEQEAFFSNNKVPEKLSVLDLKPDSIHIEFDKALEKEVPVVLNGRFQYAENHKLADSIQVIPSKVRLKGPKTFVKDINQVKTKDFHFKKIQGKKVFEMALEKPDYPFVSCSHKNVKVIVPVETVTEKSLKIPVEFQNPYYRGSIRLIPSTIKASFAVPLSQYPNITARDFRAVVKGSLTNQSHAPSRLKVFIVKKPDFIYNLRYQPRKVRYLIPQKAQE